MAKHCEICGKSVQIGNRVSHAENKTKRPWLPNVQKVRAIINGSAKRISVCTRCLRSGRVTRAI
ncbi:MAG: 50S ribosomal protein L28 [Bacillota bacterium]